MAALCLSTFLPAAGAASPSYPSPPALHSRAQVLRSYLRRRIRLTRRTVAVAALAEPEPPRPIGDGQDGDQALRPLLQELAGSLILPSDYLAKLPADLRQDLNDAAFDLSSGPVLDECGEEVGELLLNLARAWEMADTSTSNSLVSRLPSLESFLTDPAKVALGKRLVSAARRFEGMGQYGQGELQRIAKGMSKTGKFLSRSLITNIADETKKERRKLKFGELEFEVTAEKAIFGALVGVVFGIVSWLLAQAVQSTPESSLQYANDNALLLSKSLRGALLALCYSSTFLSAFTSVGLLLIARQLSLNSEDSS